MAGVRDYLEMRGDVVLGERPFNDVDNVVLASFSYLDLRGIADAPGLARLSVRKTCEAFLERAAGEDIAPWVRSLASIDARFVRALGESARFGSAMVRDYVDVIDDERTLQFAALTVDLPDGCSYVSFRGTDNGLVGWKEDFMLSFRVTGAQRSATAYLEREAERALAEGRRLYVGGHSKGGILAAYAATMLPEHLRSCVARVWSNDGPGMWPGAAPERASEVLGDAFSHVIPAYDIVGMLFDDGSEKLIVKSSADGALQHDPMTWQVRPAGLVETEDLEPDCVRMNAALAGWLDGMDPDERERFTDELFDVLQAGGASRLDEILASAQSIQKVLSALTAADQRTKDLVRELLGATISANVESAKDAVVNALAKPIGWGLAGNRLWAGQQTEQ